MKRTIFILVGMTFCLICFSQSQDFMVIEKTDNTMMKMNLDDIKRIFFENNYVNPKGAKAEAVDLGLPSGVKWASWNLGASSPDEFGGYYGWADPTGLLTSTNNTDYPSANPPANISGTQYDIAKAMWGDDWRLPTKEDLNELFEYCSFYISGNNIEVEGPNKNYIIFPLAGIREGEAIEETIQYGYYWTGSIYDKDNNYAWMLHYDMEKKQYALIGGSRCFGASVRPVLGHPQYFTVTTGSASNLTENGAIISGSVSGVSQSINVGIIYGTTSDLSSQSGTRKSTTSSGSFTITLSGLEASTKYYYRAFAELNGLFHYGEIKSFTTKDKKISGTENGYPWVDLGLPSGIKWATYNVGATTPFGYGSYFAWGETSTKSKYMEKTYTYINKTNIEGTSNDVAHVKWGGKWRMPTENEMIELIHNCHISFKTINGVTGLQCEGPNGQTVFLPLGGHHEGEGVVYYTPDHDCGSSGYYWSGTGGFGSTGKNYGIGLGLDISSPWPNIWDQVFVQGFPCYKGFTVRAVFK